MKKKRKMNVPSGIRADAFIGSQSNFLS